jgi:putative salt-induced outer membrane protein YdiY
MWSRCPAILLTAFWLTWPAVTAPLGAQDAAPGGTPAVDAKAFEFGAPGLRLSANLGYVATSGNSRSATLGFGFDLDRRWESQGVTLSASGTRASSSADLDFALGTSDSFEVVRPDPEPSAEYYGVRGRYDHRLSQRVFALGGAGWERNLFAGLRSRFVAEAGFGYVILADASTDFRARVGATYTNNREVVPNPELENNFAGARLSWTLRRHLSGTADLVHDLVLDENLNQTDDLRADATLGLAVSISSRLALAVNYRLLYRKLPALRQLPLRDAAGGELGSVAVPLREVDQGFSVSLVVEFERGSAPGS